MSGRTKLQLETETTSPDYDRLLSLVQAHADLLGQLAAEDTAIFSKIEAGEFQAQDYVSMMQRKMLLMQDVISTHKALIGEEPALPN